MRVIFLFDGMILLILIALLLMWALWGLWGFVGGVALFTIALAAQ